MQLTGAATRRAAEEEPPMAFNASTRAYLASTDDDTDDTRGFGDRDRYEEYADDGDDGDAGAIRRALRKGNRERRWAAEPRRAPDGSGFGAAPRRRGPTRAARTGAESFKCRHCRAFVGPTIGGGRHRNHCPLCLHSRHVDGKRPGDRASECGSLMAPVARFDRPDGEPVLVHRCLGCGFERHNRLAADDNILLLARLPLVAPHSGRPSDQQDEAAGDERRRVS
jgi:hypothetical protein